MSSYPPPQTRLPQPKYPHKILHTIWAVLRQIALGFLVLLIAAALLASLFDIALQLLRSNRASKVSDTIITFGTYVVVVVLGFAILASRAISGRSILSSIPKGYLPIGKSDVPKKAHELISNEYDRAAVIASISQPKGRQQEGWGRPGTEYENTHFRSAILSTVEITDAICTLLLPDPSRPEKRPRAAASLSYLPSLLAVHPSPIPTALTPLVELYEQHLARAKYGAREPDEKDHDEVVKIVAVLVGVLSDVQLAALGQGTTGHPAVRQRLSQINDVSRWMAHQ